MALKCAFLAVRNPFTCELCDVELANKQELEDHLESKTHWDTMEHIQRESNYDDLTVAFLQVRRSVDGCALNFC